MTGKSKSPGAATAMRQINQVWLDNRIEDLAPLVHSETVSLKAYSN